jgi:hypothetical protein
MSFLYREPAKIIRDILIEEMDLEPAQILLSNQKFIIPTVGLYGVVSYLGPANVICRMSELVPDGLGGQIELQSVTMQHVIEIQLMAYNDPEGGNQARARFGEIPMALGSIFSQQIQEQYAMMIARHPSGFTDASFLEETEMMTRYSTTIKTQSVNQKQKESDQYYSTFPGALVYKDDYQPNIQIPAPPVNPLAA